MVRWVCKSIFTWGAPPCMIRESFKWECTVVRWVEVGRMCTKVRMSQCYLISKSLHEVVGNQRSNLLEHAWIIPSHCPNCHGFINIHIINLTLASMDLCKGQLTGNHRTPLGFHMKNQALLWICLSFSTLVQMNQTGAQSPAPVLVQGKPETRTNVKLETKTAFL